MESFCNIQLWGSAWLTTRLHGLVFIPCKLFYYIKWVNCHLQPWALFFIVVTPHIQRCVYSFINVWCHHTILGHNYDVTTFQTIVMSQVARDIIMPIVHCWCHDIIVDVTNNNKMLMAINGRSLHCGDLHRNIPGYNILVVPSQVLG